MPPALEIVSFSSRLSPLATAAIAAAALACALVLTTLRSATSFGTPFNLVTSAWLSSWP